MTDCLIISLLRSDLLFILIPHVLFRGRTSLCAIASCYRLEDWNLNLSCVRFSGLIQISLEVHIPSSTTDTGSFPGRKRQGLGAGHPPHSSVGAEYGESYNDTALCPCLAFNRQQLPFITLRL